MIKHIIARGDVWLVNLDPTCGHEQAKTRPCIVISPTAYNHNLSKLAVIIPITSKYRSIPWFVEINPPEGGLKVRSYAISDQIRTVSLERFSGKALGSISQVTLFKIEQRLRVLLGM